MKKLLLLLCAILSTLGGVSWAQTNLVSGKSVVIDNTTTGNTYSDAQRLLITNGVKSNSEDADTNLKLTKAGDNNVIDWFYFDFEESKTPKTIAITWTNCRPISYKIYLSDEVPTNENKGTEVFTTESTPEGGAVTTFHTLTGDVSGQYISLVPAQSSVNDWGCILSEIEVYEAYTPALTTLIASCGQTSLPIGDNATITVSGKDQIGLPIATGDLTWESTDNEIVSVSNGIVTANAVGSGSIKAKSGTIESNSISFTVLTPVTEPATPTIADENIKVIYIGDDSKSATGLVKYRASDYKPTGWSRKALKYDSGNNVELVMASNDVSDMTYMHLDIYPLEATTLALFVNGPSQNWNGYDINEGNEIPAGAWFSVDIPVSFFTETCSHAMNTLTNIVFCKNVANKSEHAGFADFGAPYKSFVIGNVYFWKEATSYTITATAGTTTLSKGGTTNITTTVTDTDASDVTSSSTITYTSDDTDVVTVSSDGKVTANGLGSATVTVSVIYNELEKTKTIDFTVNPPAAKEPTDDEANVLAVYSDTYSATSTMTVEGDTRGNISNAGWNGGYTAVSQVSFSAGDNVIKVDGVSCFGIQTGNVDISDYDFLKVSIYSEKSYDGYIRIEGTEYGQAGERGTKNYPISLTAGIWNDLTIALKGTRTTATWIQMYVGSEKNNNVFIDNVYYLKLTPGSVYVCSPDMKGIAEVKGTVTSSNKSVVEASDAKIIDISNATLDGGVTSISLANNQLLLVNSTSTAEENDEKNIVSSQATQLSGNTTNVIVNNGAYYWGYNQINYIDDNAHQPTTDISINVNKAGYTIERTIATSKYVTTCLPLAITTIPTGLTAYELDKESTTSEVKFKKVTSMAANTPYVLHNYSDGAVVLLATQPENEGAGNINLDLTVSPASVANDASTITFKGNYSVINGDGSTMWGLQNSTNTNPEFKQIGTGAKIGAFRAYFTGLTSAGARAFFIDDNGTTSIKKIEDILNHEDIYYNLNGQRVQNPTKGIYILNGKKVIIK